MDPQRIAAITFFAGLPEQEVGAVAQVAEEVDFAVGQQVTAEGEFGHGLFVIEEGSAEVLSNGTRVDLVGPGAVVGEVAVLASGRRTASVVAVTPLRTIALFKRDVWALDGEAPEVARRLREALVQHVRAEPASSDAG